ncbi:hypothetical protein BFR69_00695 [Acinetobacter pittii]|uniref:hypothetical protein n=2 Tax=Acinetobacter pittii TaxID=48296 RepID=UPI0002D027EF|nr:hypothetical protein [Acinetobacter pittii]ENW11176.1 hypothetical protein F928_02975 [Acinetobacter pittii ATCC 19004 = CIP 70.29]KRI14799.1 hypothetical protein APC96_12300 [Acinetobacter pittii]MBJ8447551.1 hypothetical protein [Acinetobacter pittii]MCG9522389.1 hypothetical protein [Acinetobacter pittii]MCK0869334.1 hypothetical protein [Acinetobacter pittii]
MKQIKIEGLLPVPLKKLVGQTDIKSQKVVMRQLTAIEYLESQASIEAGHFVAIADLASMTKLIDDDGDEHEITYEMLGHSSRANLKYLDELRNQLDAKEAAESSSDEQESSEN